MRTISGLARIGFEKFRPNRTQKGQGESRSIGTRSTGFRKNGAHPFDFAQGTLWRALPSASRVEQAADRFGLCKLVVKRNGMLRR